VALSELEGRYKVLGNDDVADTNVRKHRFGKSTEIEDAPIVGQSLKCGNGARFVVEFTVVVILDD